MTKLERVALIGTGMAGLSCAKTPRCGPSGRMRTVANSRMSATWALVCHYVHRLALDSSPGFVSVPGSAGGR